MIWASQCVCVCGKPPLLPRQQKTRKREEELRIEYCAHYSANMINFGWLERMQILWLHKKVHEKRRTRLPRGNKEGEKEGNCCLVAVNQAVVNQTVQTVTQRASKSNPLNIFFSFFPLFHSMQMTSWSFLCLPCLICNSYQLTFSIFSLKQTNF